MAREQAFAGAFCGVGSALMDISRVMVSSAPNFGYMQLKENSKELTTVSIIPRVLRSAGSLSSLHLSESAYVYFIYNIVGF